METSDWSESIMYALSNLMGPTFSSRALSSNGSDHTRNKRKSCSVTVIFDSNLFRSNAAVNFGQAFGSLRCSSPIRLRRNSFI
ncbi:hypothetical protein VNO80_10676 [Phaseolus coccineus]|uniref:Uncharacterized protein n=1 Tax=Phaseolus coccineus TaxID=3886 RepID=A0AAN9NF00_PHACN